MAAWHLPILSAVAPRYLRGPPLALPALLLALEPLPLPLHLPVPRPLLLPRPPRLA